MIHLDFETRSQVDIWQVGAWNYSCHPSTEIICMAFAIDDGPVLVATAEDIELNCLPPAVRRGDIYTAHNAFFEQAIWANILVKRYGWPRIPILQWRCSAAKAAARSLPRSLELCARALGTKHQKEMSGKRVMLKLARSQGEMDEKDLETLYEYCRQDVEVERDIDKALPDLTEKEQTIWMHDQLINQRGVAVDKQSIDAALELISEHNRTLNTAISNLTGGQLDGVSRRTAVMNWIKKQGVEINGYTKKDVQDLLKQSLPERVRQVLETRVQLGKTSVKKYEAMQKAVDEDGRIRDLLLYHGANTGRWSGKLVQIQNLPSSKGHKYNMEALVESIKTGDLEMYYGDVMGWLSKAIRGMFVASEGKKLLVADYNAIEARVLFWLAGDETGLRAYRENRDIYVDTARAIYNKPDISKDERQLGKTTILACISKGSLIYSDKGSVPIETISQGQKIWDGLEWANFQGLVPVGKKNVIQIGSLAVTPDHRLLTRHGWRLAGEIALSGDTTPLLLGKYLADGRLLAENITSVLNVVSLSVANAELRKIEESTSFGVDVQRHVENVLKDSTDKRAGTPVNTLILSLIRVFAEDGAIATEIFASDVQTHLVKTLSGMVLEGFTSPSTIVERSWNTLLLWMGGGLGDSLSIELIMPKGTPQAILDLLHKERTISTRVEECFDIVGLDNERLQVEGFIAHNCGYGMGVNRFLATCSTFGMSVDEQLAEKAVRGYRSNYNAVPRFWSAVEQSARRTISTKQDTNCGKIRWTMDNDVLLCQLPSGRSIAYNKASIVDNKIKFFSVDSVTRQWVEDDTYGGKLVENICQGVARDILAEAMLRAERIGYPIVMHVHDEAVAETDRDLQYFMHCLEVVPNWAEGLPLKVEGFECRRYQK